METPDSISLLHEAHDEFVCSFRKLNSYFESQNNFLKGAYWSPDGKVILTASEDGCLRLYANPQYEDTSGYTPKVGKLLPWLQTEEGETIFDFCWYPLMNWAEPETCFYASTTRGHPIHLYNPLTSILLSYTSLDDAEQHTPNYSIGLHPLGHSLFGGSYNKVFEYKIDRPGGPYKIHKLSTRKSKDTQKGIISSFAHNLSLNLVACGSYAKSIYLYDPYTKFSLVDICLDSDTTWGGVTHLKWLGEYHLASSHRCDNFIRYWDVRKPSEVLFRFYRPNSTQQRLVFDTCGDTLYTGDSTGHLFKYNTKSFQFISRKQIQNSPVVSASIHPYLPLLLTSSGTKSFKMFDEISTSDSDEDAGATNIRPGKTATKSSSYLDNFVRIWFDPLLKDRPTKATSTPQDDIDTPQEDTCTLQEDKYTPQEETHIIQEGIHTP